jgi:hypothetical protein
VPRKKELLRVVRRLELRGWHREVTVEEGIILTTEEWSAIVGTGSAPDEAKEQAAPNPGGLTITAMCAV